MEGHWKFLGGGGLRSQHLKKQIMKSTKLEFPVESGGGGGGAKQKAFCGGSLNGYFLKIHYTGKADLSKGCWTLNRTLHFSGIPFLAWFEDDACFTINQRKNMVKL